MERPYQNDGIANLEQKVASTTDARILRGILAELENHRKLTARVADLIEEAQDKVVSARRKRPKRPMKVMEPKGCPDCKGRTACGAPHVYVIELPADAADDPKLKGRRGGVPLYIGSSHHTEACVFRQHAAAHTRQATYTCQCFEETVDRKPKKRSLTGKYGTARLRLDLTEGQNPVDHGPAAEEELSNRLKRRFRVYWN